MKRKCILIIDDECYILEALQRILTKLGYKTEAAETFSTALMMYLGKTYDLVLVDLMMSETNGIEIIKEIRKVNPKQKIVITTGLGPDSTELRNSEVIGHIRHVLYKPFTFRGIESMMAEAIENN